MSASPTPNLVVRALLGIVAALMLCGCLTSGESTSDPSEPDAKAAKQEMDAAAAEILPALSARLGGTMSLSQARFYERGGFGIWDYAAHGFIIRPPGTMSAVLDATEEVMTKHGYTVTREPGQKRVSGTKGNVSLIVQAGLLKDVRTVSSLNLNLEVNGIFDGDEFDEDAPPEDYATILE